MIPEWLFIISVVVAWIQAGFLTHLFLKRRHEREMGACMKDFKEVAQIAENALEELQRYRTAELLLRQVVLTPRTPSDPTLLN